MTLALLIGLSAAGLTAIARTVAQDHGNPEWLLVKPLSCDLCMSFWGSLISTVIWSISRPFVVPEFVLTITAGVGVSLVAIKAANRLGD